MTLNCSSVPSEVQYTGSDIASDPLSSRTSNQVQKYEVSTPALMPLWTSSHESAVEDTLFYA